MSESPSCWGTTLSPPCLVVIGQVETEIYLESILYVIWPHKTQMIEGSSNFNSWNFSWYVTTLSSLVTVGIVVVELKCFSLTCDEARSCL